MISAQMTANKLVCSLGVFNFQLFFFFSSFFRFSLIHDRPCSHNTWSNCVVRWSTFMKSIEFSQLIPKKAKAGRQQQQRFFYLINDAFILRHWLFKCIRIIIFIEDQIISCRRAFVGQWTRSYLHTHTHKSEIEFKKKKKNNKIHESWIT